ncbi:hypothetical protein CN918_30955 [Priestia megaterium]|nr:hypothetical protein CN918_30955 [Priestia megaterium]
MIQLGINKFINGTEIQIGDILETPAGYAGVVLFGADGQIEVEPIERTIEKEHTNFPQEIIKRMDVWHDLDDILRDKSIVIAGSVLKRNVLPWGEKKLKEKEQQENK